MKWPRGIYFCRGCRGKALPAWFKYKRQEWIDMDYPYPDFRPVLVKTARHDLCKDCADMLISLVDKENGYMEERI